MPGAVSEVKDTKVNKAVPGPLGNPHVGEARSRRDRNSFNHNTIILIICR